jgi:hypothetical protein
MTKAMEAAARIWCEALARTLPVQHISPNGTPYLDRYFAAGWTPPAHRRTGTDRREPGRDTGPAIFLHHFVASDPDDHVHSHPWGWSASLILAGGYREHRCVADGSAIVREYKPGDINVLEANDRHRVDLLEADCWSVFLAGNFQQAWTFAPSCGVRR